MYAMLFGLIEIFAFGVTETPTAKVETKAVSPADASVQVLVDRGLLKSRFSGTAIAPNLVVTCWHGFRERGTVSVNGKPAKLLRFDSVSDVALVETSEKLDCVPVASKPVAKGDTVTAYGYEYTRKGLWKFPASVTAVNRYSGFPNVSINSPPAQGRSGGGLFNDAGELIGVCSARDGNEGLYCGLEAVQKIVNPTVKESVTVPTIQESRTVQDCPDGRCPLLPKQGSKPQVPSKGNTPTLAPPEPKVIVQARPLRSVMVRPVKRLFQGRIFSRLRCR